MDPEVEAHGMPQISQRRALVGYIVLAVMFAIVIGGYQHHVDKRQDRTDKRLAFAIAGLEVQQQQLQLSKRKIQENAKTAQVLCDAAGGARDFWIKVRASTILMLTDKTLSDTARQANLAFVSALTDVIRAADGVAHHCD